MPPDEFKKRRFDEVFINGKRVSVSYEKTNPK